MFYNVEFLKIFEQINNLYYENKGEGRSVAKILNTFFNSEL
jgi:hypothetical protein